MKRRRRVVGSSDEEGRSGGEGSDAEHGTEQPGRCAAGRVGAESGSDEQARAEESPAQHALDAVAQLTALVQVLRCMMHAAKGVASRVTG